MAKNTIEPQNDPEVMIEEAINQSESFIYTNGKKLITALVIIIVIVGGYFAYTGLYTTPRQEKASAMMFAAEQAFARDNLEAALSGDGSAAGFLDVISQYGTTPQGNIAQHYAGACYLHLGQYEKAIAFLSAYRAVSGTASELINAQNIGMQGDAYLQLANRDKAISLYESAVAASDNNLTAPYYLFKAASLYQAMGNNAKALEAYKRIQNEYSGSVEAQGIERYIGQIEQL